MKIYLIDYNLDERENKKIYVSQYSSYKIGINVNGVDNSSISLIKDADTYINSEGDFKGYNTYSFEAGTPGTTTLEIYVPFSDTGITLPLTVITTDSTVAELSSGSGGSVEIPADLELSSLKVGNSDYPTINANENNLYLKGQDLKVTVDYPEYPFDVIRVADIYDMNTDETYQGVAIQCDDIQVNKTINCGNLNCYNGTISFNYLTGENFIGGIVDVPVDFNAPGIHTYRDEYSNPKLQMTGSNILIENPDKICKIVMGEYDDITGSGEIKSGFALHNITEMTFVDDAGMPQKVVPTDITDGSGMTYRVLTLQPLF